MSPPRTLRDDGLNVEWGNRKSSLRTLSWVERSDLATCPSGFQIFDAVTIYTAVLKETLRSSEPHFPYLYNDDSVSLSAL